MSPEAFAQHPAIIGATEPGEDRARAVAFAADLADYLFGGALEERSALVRVVARVAKREIVDPRAVCRGRAMASVEAAARATAALWPWLRALPERLRAEGAADPARREGPPGGAGGGSTRADGGPDAGTERPEDGAASGVSAGARGERPRDADRGDEDAAPEERTGGDEGGGDDDHDDGHSDEGGGDDDRGDSDDDGDDAGSSGDADGPEADGNEGPDDAVGPEDDGAEGLDDAVDDDGPGDDGGPAAGGGGGVGGGQGDGADDRDDGGSGGDADADPDGTEGPDDDGPDDAGGGDDRDSDDPGPRLGTFGLAGGGAGGGVDAGPTAVAAASAASPGPTVEITLPTGPSEDPSTQPDASNSPDASLPEPVLEAMRAALDGALAADRLERRLGALLPGLGWSHATAALQHHLLADLPRWSALLDDLPALDQLAAQLGRVEGASRRAGEAVGGSEEVVGVHFAGDAARALPSELALLGGDDTEDLFYARWAEHRLLSLELEGAGLDGVAMGDRLGPVIACLDTSGSMEGAPELAAKALLLAVVRKVVPRGRAVHALLFGGPHEVTELRIARGRGGLDAVLDFLGWRFSAGTDFDTPLVRAIELLDERDWALADVLVVTDGLGWASEEVVAQVNAARAARGVRVWSVLVGRGGPEGLRAFSDEVWLVDPREAAAASGLLRRLR